jgi:hypothetical protein
VCVTADFIELFGLPTNFVPIDRRRDDHVGRRQVSVEHRGHAAQRYVDAGRLRQAGSRRRHRRKPFFYMIIFFFFMIL